MDDIVKEFYREMYHSLMQRDPQYAGYELGTSMYVRRPSDFNFNREQWMLINKEVEWMHDQIHEWTKKIEANKNYCKCCDDKHRDCC